MMTPYRIVLTDELTTHIFVIRDEMGETAAGDGGAFICEP